jgi:hypothetical protein
LTGSLSQVESWGGSAASVYRNLAQTEHSAVAGLSAAAGAMAEITEAAGLVVATVRVLVRDLIAIAFSRAVVYVTEEVFSLGFATPLVAVQVSTLVLQCSARISRLLHGLVNSLERLFTRRPDGWPATSMNCAASWPASTRPVLRAAASAVSEVALAVAVASVVDARPSVGTRHRRTARPSGSPAGTSSPKTPPTAVLPTTRVGRKPRSVSSSRRGATCLGRSPVRQ